MATRTIINVDLQSQTDDVDLQPEYWVLSHPGLTGQNRQLLIEAHAAKESVTVSLLFWPGDNTEYKCTALVASIAPKFHLDLVSKIEIPTSSRQRLVSQQA